MARSFPLRVPTLFTDGPQVRHEICYLALPSSATVAELIAEKVRAELRKMRMGASADTTIAPLVGPGMSDEPLAADAAAESTAILRAWDAFNVGHLTVLVDGHVAVRLDQRLNLRRNSVILFYPRAVVASC